MKKNLKKALFLAALTALAVPAMLAAALPGMEGYTEIKAKTDTVTVYQQNAFVERLGNVTLTAGNNRFYVSGLPPELMEDTLLVYKPDKIAKYVIKEFEFRTIQAQVALKDKEKEIADRLQVLKSRLLANQDSNVVMDDRIKFLRSLSAKSTEEISKQLLLKDIDVKGAGAMLKLISDGIEESLAKKRAYTAAITRINSEIRELTSRLSGIQSEGTKTVKVLFMDIEAAAGGEAGLGIKYVVQGASWTPYYESNLDFSKGKIETKMFARITQYTSEKWNDVKLVIATGSPAFDSTLPELSPWVIDEMRAQYRAAYGNAPAPMSVKKSEVLAETAAMDESEPAYEKRVESVKFSEINMQMRVKDRYNVPNGGARKKVYIKQYRFDVKEMFYTAVPSRNGMAYLTASFKNETKELLMPGPVTLYLDDSYSGRASLAGNIGRGEEVKFSYGTDESVKVEKERLVSKRGDSGIFGQDKKTDFSYKITMKNYKARPITLIVKEPVPVAALDKIKVDFYEESIKHDSIDDRNIYTWKITLQPEEKKELVYRFSVTHPKDMNVTGL